GHGPRRRRHGGPSAPRDRARRRARPDPGRRGDDPRRRRPRARCRGRARAPAEAGLGLLAGFEGGLRKTLARMGISAVASYIGGALIDVVDLDATVVERCFPTAAAWPGRTTLRDIAERQLRRRAAATAIPEPPRGREVRLPDPGFA